MESKTVQDLAIGAGAISAPMWVVMIGGLVLVSIRIWNAVQERRNGAD